MTRILWYVFVVALLKGGTRGVSRLCAYVCCAGGYVVDSMRMGVA